MGNAPVIDKASEAMVVTAASKFLSGKYALAAEQATKYLESIEGNTAQVRETFGPVMVKLYCVRAQSRYMLGAASNDQAIQEEARIDVEKALNAVDGAYHKLAPDVLAVLKEKIRNSTHPDPAVRKASFEAVVEAATEVLPKTTKFMAHAVFFLIGAAVWSILLFLVTLTGDSSSFPIFVLGVVLIGAVFLAIEGWDWMSQYKFGTKSSLIKYMAVIVIGMTGIGLLPIFYWTGKGAMRVIAKVRN